MLWISDMQNNFMNRLLIVVIASFLFFAQNASAAYKVELKPKPNPPEVGQNTIIVKLTDAEGKPVNDAKVTLLPFMPAMGSMPRMEQKSQVTLKGNGLYEVVFELPMGGTWEIILSVEKDGRPETFFHSLTTGIPDVSSKNPSMSASQSGKSLPTNAMNIGPERLQKIGVRFAEVKTIGFERKIEAVGVVEQDRTHREEMTLRFSGYVIKQFKGREGDSVNAGDPLFTVYSPELVAAQSEFLLANKVEPMLREAAQGRLKNMGMAQSDINQIVSSGKVKRDVTIRSPISGTILEILVREGSAVSTGQPVYVVGDLSQSFIVARVFQQDVNDLRAGQPAEVSLPGRRLESAHGRLDLIYPQVEQGAGTTNVRVEVTEYLPDIRPGTYVDVTFPVALGNRLAVPAESVLYSGKNRYVFIDLGAGVLEPREVDVGATAGDMVEVRSGLKEGERVVSSGTFLVGSEAQLRSALPKWKNATKDTEAHKHEEEQAK
jgi:membrane fusion protein, copper/silver efflux system